MIQRLPETLINQIAAGEVVDRPASALKELVENSLDAKATQIDVHLLEGGLSEIRIVDDGIGISPEELQLATERHATSKISAFSDLESLASYGFRGEALSSISSISEFEITSRRRGQDDAYRTRIEFGTPSGSLTRVGAPEGTQVCVKRIFERVPARAKFLKSPASEYAACMKPWRELALANPDIAFSLSHQEQAIAHFPATALAARFDACFRPKWTPMEIHAEHEACTLTAYLSPSDWISDKGTLHLFLNRRPIKHRAFLQAVRQSYAQALGPHHEPSGALFLEIRPDWIDPNVHPQKLEVRCLHSDALFSWLSQTVRKSVSSYRSPRELESLPSQASVAWDDAESLQPLSPQTEKEDPRPKSAPAPAARRPLALSEPVPQAPTAVPLPMDAYTPAFRPTSLGNRPIAGLRYLAQLRASYLLAEDDSGLIVIDQHALHERIRFEQLRSQWSLGAIPSQRMLVPSIVRAPEATWNVLEAEDSAFHGLGFEFTRVGAEEIALRATPATLDERTAISLFEHLAEALVEGGPPTHARDQFWKKVERSMATAACHSAVRANHALTPVEALALVDALRDTLPSADGADPVSAAMGWTCPHGRPVLFRLSFQEIEKHFERT